MFISSWYPLLVLYAQPYSLLSVGKLIFSFYIFFFYIFKSRQLWSHLDHNSVSANCRVAASPDSKIVLFPLCKFPQKWVKWDYCFVFISTISGNECTPKAVSGKRCSLSSVLGLMLVSSCFTKARDAVGSYVIFWETSGIRNLQDRYLAVSEKPGSFA